jgi:hypothetical protein
MYLDIDELKKIDNLTWHSIPSDKFGIIKDECYKAGDYELIMLRNPVTISNESLVAIEYSMIVKLNGNNVLTVNLEKDDLRALSSSFGCKLKDMQEEYDTKSNYGPIHTVLYSYEDKEDLGVYNGETDLMSIKMFFIELLMDTLDCDEELEPLFVN